MQTEGEYWKLIEPHWERISIYDGAEAFLREFDATPVAVRTLFAAHWCQSEVCNGGFHQFFWNPTGVLAPEAAAAFEALNMPGIAALVRRAMRFFGPAFPRERERRVEVLDEYRDAHADAPSPFESIDDEFDELRDEEAGGWETAANDYANREGGSPSESVSNNGKKPRPFP